jgi:tRNA G18 (ribose-2'-O)-methylase SpoU
VNPQAVERCPFVNPARKEIYTSADPSEMIGIEEEIENAKKDAKLSLNDEATEDVYQKKIMPWEMMLETDMDLTKHLVKKNRRRNELIVVASLIDRLPNLAGLCRTCEIFNASHLVVPTLKIKDDLGFTTISVASEKWMPMIEVAEPDVGKFLQEKKDEGYTLCGLEQTTTSATLGDYQFPEKCVLLLGKERQGVPADLLQMLDVTIEIPQYGITRSLNVHVSGAICVYEYTKQMHWRQQQQAIISQQQQ